MTRTWLGLLVMSAGVIWQQSCSSSAQQRQAETASADTSDAATAPDFDDSGAAEADTDLGDAAGGASGLDPREAERLAALDTALAAIKKMPASDAPLRFEVVQQGPGLPWILVILNQSDQSYVLAGDSRLLRLDVEVPGKRRMETCELPSSVKPSRVESQTRVELPPGGAVVETFDPRLYCFSSAGQERLVPGAIVKPQFGWTEKMKVRWEKGQRIETPLEKQKPPYIAAPTGGTDRTSLNSLAEDPLEPSAPAVIKTLKGSPIALGSEYAAWSRDGIEPALELAEPADQGPFELQMSRGSDAQAERTATITVTLKNRSKVKYPIYFRRELLTFQVLGPNGQSTCDPKPDDRSPDPLAYTTMSPGETMRVMSRLVELCPKGTFGAPGLYLIHARYDAAKDGAEHGLDAWTGQVTSSKPAEVRVRTASEHQRWAPLQAYDTQVEARASD